ncbi:HAD family hydrolase [Exiguobacterium sp. SL-10]|uniref:HAD family hydrolase n=1 Tax=Exiguobacterium sp. SL-10 TaxID=2510962 RepID=UPI00103C49EF|nr:HAD-IA family hydrolase [Exiguobacterium sp. SL-10]TCI28209.1 HAD family hydrolase [Exiguobacterium sp. SL-10]
MTKYKGIIFDLDETLVDTTMLTGFRESRNWPLCYTNIHRTLLYDNVDVLLQKIVDSQIKIGIVTMSPQSYAKKVLSHHNIEYDVLIAFHDVHNRKPHPEPMFKCLESLELLASEVISLGDDVKDIKSSISAGIYAIGLDSSSQRRGSLISAGAQKVFDNYYEIDEFIFGGR